MIKEEKDMAVLRELYKQAKDEFNELGKFSNSQLQKAEAVVEAGKKMSDQILKQATYRSSTSTINADNFLQLLAEYEKKLERL